MRQARRTAIINGCSACFRNIKNGVFYDAKNDDLEETIYRKLRGSPFVCPAHCLDVRAAFLHYPYQSGRACPDAADCRRLRLGALYCGKRQPQGNFFGRCLFAGGRPHFLPFPYSDKRAGRCGIYLPDAGYPASLCRIFGRDLLYTNCPGNDMRFDAVAFPQDYTVTDFAPGETVRCSLPGHYAGKRLTIATAHIAETTGMPGILLSSHAVRSALQIADVGNELMPAAGYATLTLLLSGIWLFALFQGIRDYPSLLLILAALTQMLSRLRQFSFFPLSPSPWTARLRYSFPSSRSCSPVSGCFCR